MNICNSEYWYIDRSVGDKVSRGNNYGVDSDVYYEGGSCYSERV